MIISCDCMWASYNFSSEFCSSEWEEKKKSRPLLLSPVVLQQRLNKRNMKKRRNSRNLIFLLSLHFLSLLSSARIEWRSRTQHNIREGKERTLKNSAPHTMELSRREPKVERYFLAVELHSEFFFLSWPFHHRGARRDWTTMSWANLLHSRAARRVSKRVEEKKVKRASEEKKRKSKT